MASGPASVRLLPPACTRVPDVAKAVAAPCVRVRPCPSVDPEGSPELKQQSLSDGRSSESVTRSHLSPHDILLPVPDSERKHDAGKMAGQVDTGGRDMSLISDAPTRDKTVAQKRAPPLCKGLRERCIGGAPSFTFDPHSFLKHPEKIGSSAFAALVSLQAKILAQSVLLYSAACLCLCNDAQPCSRVARLLTKSRFI